MDIGSNNSYPAGALSNFTARTFVFDGIVCASMEGLLQAFKFENINSQMSPGGLIGFAAKKKGSNRNKRWKSMQTLWWNLRPYKRNSKEYQELLDRAYNTMYEQSESLRKQLKDAGNSIFTHSIGRNDEKETVLTEREFCSRMQKLKDFGRI